MSIWTITTCCYRWNITFGASIFNLIDNRLTSIKHIQNKYFGGVDVLMTYQTPPMKDNWIIQNIEDDVNALAPNFEQTYVQCYELNKIMCEFNMVFIQTLNKFRTTIKKYKRYSIYKFNL
jgi:hypothetical protein